MLCSRSRGVPMYGSKSLKRRNTESCMATECMEPVTVWNHVNLKMTEHLDTYSACWLLPSHWFEEGHAWRRLGVQWAEQTSRGVWCQSCLATTSGTNTCSTERQYYMNPGFLKKPISVWYLPDIYTTHIHQWLYNGTQLTVDICMISVRYLYYIYTSMVI